MDTEEVDEQMLTKEEQVDMSYLETLKTQRRSISITSLKVGNEIKERRHELAILEAKFNALNDAEKAIRTLLRDV